MGRAKYHPVTVPSTGEHVEKQDLSCVAAGNVERCGRSGHHLAASALAFWGLYSCQRNNSLCMNTSLYVMAQSSFIVINKTWKQLGCPTLGVKTQRDVIQE
jgi:hypothetical protein